MTAFPVLHLARHGETAWSLSEQHTWFGELGDEHRLDHTAVLLWNDTSHLET